MALRGTLGLAAATLVAWAFDAGTAGWAVAILTPVALLLINFALSKKCCTEEAQKNEMSSDTKI
jgi:hypothetical protein